MKTRQYSKYAPKPWGAGTISTCVADYRSVSNESLRDAKRNLILKPQVYDLKHDRLIDYLVIRDRFSGLNDAQAPRNASIGRNDRLNPFVNWSNIDNVALAKYNGRLHYGGASLGITIAQWGQADFMLRDRFKKLNSLFFGVERRLERNLRTKSGRRRFKRDRALGRNPRYTRRTRDPLAGQILEYSFGWEPLVKEVLSITNGLFTHAIPDEYVRAAQKVWHEDVQIDANSTLLKQTTTYRGWASTTVSANVAISNPNLWLANRAGLLNVPGIIWDAIPWSFLVGMFVNANQLLGQFTNEVGLSITDRSTTRKMHMHTIRQTDYRTSSLTSHTRTMNRLLYIQKQRVVGSFPTVSLQWKVPTINPQLIAIASALVVQRMGNISRLLDLSYMLTKRF